MASAISTAFLWQRHAAGVGVWDAESLGIDSQTCFSVRAMTKHDRPESKTSGTHTHMQTQTHTHTHTRARTLTNPHIHTHTHTQRRAHAHRDANVQRPGRGREREKNTYRHTHEQRASHTSRKPLAAGRTAGDRQTKARTHRERVSEYG